MNDVLKFLQPTETTDEYGDPQITYSSREVFCAQRSIGQKEFYQAQAVGMQPEIKFVIADYLDYQKEPLVEYDGIRYRVLRTFRKGQELEITVYQEVNPA